MANKRILIVDDDDNIRELLKELFISSGYDVDEVDSGTKGFEKAVTGNYDLVTMDIRMPNWDGVETIMGLNLVKDELKFLVISGYLSEYQFGVLKNSNHVLDVIHKPFDNMHVLGIVNKYLSWGVFYESCHCGCF